MITSALGYGIAVGLLAVFVALFLGGLVSAALEIRRERKAGVPVARPAWEARHARKLTRAEQGRMPYLRGLAKGLRSGTDFAPEPPPCVHDFCVSADDDHGLPVIRCADCGVRPSAVSR